MISRDQISVLHELFNIGVGHAAGALNEILDTPISLLVPDVGIWSEDDHEDFDDDESLATVQLDFSGPLTGTAALAFPTDSASRLVDIISGEYYPYGEMSSLRVGALTEVGNIVLGAVMGSISNALGQYFEYLVPNFLESSLIQLVAINRNDDNPAVVMARIQFKVEEYLINGEILVFFSFASFTKLLCALDQLQHEANPQ